MKGRQRDHRGFVGVQLCRQVQVDASSARQTSQDANTASRAPAASLRDGASSTLDPTPASQDPGSYEDEPSAWPPPCASLSTSHRTNASGIATSRLPSAPTPMKD
jgi:hypothetical protein